MSIMKMDMCMCAAWVGGLPGLCPGISKSLVTPLLQTPLACHELIYGVDVKISVLDNSNA